MAHLGALCAASSIAYLTMFKKPSPLSVTSPLVVSMGLASYAVMPQLYTYVAQTVAVDAKSPKTAIGLMDGIGGIVGPALFSVGVSYAVAYVMNV